jgi:hypothetical protein
MDIPDLDVTTIPDPATRASIRQLLNLVETLAAEVVRLRALVQSQQDEINRLKGEQGKPPIKPNRRNDPPAPPAPPTNHSSEAERHVPRPRQKRRKVRQITIDRTQDCRLDPATLPPDAPFKGYETVVVQDLLLQTDNIAFRKEKWYVPSTGRTYLAPLPPGYAGGFGPHIKPLSLLLHYATNVSRPQILALFRQAGTDISHGTLAHWLIHDQDAFHAEQDAIVEAGLRSSPWQQIDDTPTRVNGQNRGCQGLGNPLYTAYRTTLSKARLAALDTLRNGRPRTYRLTDDALAHLDALRLAQTTRTQLRVALPWDQELDEPTLLAHLHTPLPHLHGQARQWVLDALAIAAYHAQLEFPVIRLLVCDDAPQFHMLLEDLALCWVHEGRHYKKLSPWAPAHQRALAR